MPERMSHGDYVVLQRKRAVECARRVLNGELGVIEASRELNALLHEVEFPELRDAHLVFSAVDSDTDHLPVGSVREHWAPDALAEADNEIRDAELFHGAGVAEACRQVLSALDRAV